jgi:hypothetical protein
VVESSRFVAVGETRIVSQVSATGKVVAMFDMAHNECCYQSGYYVLRDVRLVLVKRQRRDSFLHFYVIKMEAVIFLASIHSSIQ